MGRFENTVAFAISRLRWLDIVPSYVIFKHTKEKCARTCDARCRTLGFSVLQRAIERVRRKWIGVPRTVPIGRVEEVFRVHIQRFSSSNCPF